MSCELHLDFSSFTVNVSWGTQIDRVCRNHDTQRPSVQGHSLPLHHNQLEEALTDSRSHFLLGPVFGLDLFTFSQTMVPLSAELSASVSDVVFDSKQGFCVPLKSLKKSIYFDLKGALCYPRKLNYSDHCADCVSTQLMLVLYIG